MSRLLFTKTGDSVWISHLDLMRLFQRAFKRAELPLKHTQGFNPRPSVSIALPLSVGVESICEFLDFELEENNVSCDEIMGKLNEKLVDGVSVRMVYDNGRKIKDIAYLRCHIKMEYDNGIPEKAVEEICKLFDQEEVLVEKKSKSGVQDQNIIPMIKMLEVSDLNHENTILLDVQLCCQNPSLNPMQLPAAIIRHLPKFAPDFSRCCRVEVFDHNMNVFR